MRLKTLCLTTAAVASVFWFSACNKPAPALPASTAGAPAATQPAPAPAALSPAPMTSAALPAPAAAAGGGDKQAMRAACAADIAKFCPQGGKVGKCLKPHKSELSPACSAAWSARKAARRAGRSNGAGAE